MDRWRHYLLPGVEIGEGKTIGDAREKTHSRYFRENTFKRLKGGNKELLLIPGAVHTDLYDRMDIIPFDRIEAFYRQYLK